MEKRCQHTYGPAPSRRLGRSLGIDLVPLKTCSYDCIYCQLGHTTNRIIERKEYVPLDDVLRELDQRLRTGPEPDYVTLSGSGEPTLYSRLKSLIVGIKERTDRPVAVLTNGSLLWDAEVQDALLEADLVIPSLDAGDDATFQWINRPHPAVTFERMVAGLDAFCRRFSKAVWLEVLLLQGLNASGVQLERIVHLVKRIAPDRVQLNTATRPPCEEFAKPVPMDELKEVAPGFGVPTEVIAQRYSAHPDAHHPAHRENIVSLLMRRPCTLEDLAAGLGLHPNEVAKQLDQLTRAHVLACGYAGERLYYRYIARNGNPGFPTRDSTDRALSPETRGQRR